MRTRALIATVAMLLAAACGGQTKTPTPGAPGVVPTAAPYAAVPSPTVVTGSATPSATPSGTPTAGSTAEIVHVVVAGDVLSGLADKYDVPSAQIRALNNLTTDTLQIGQRVRIPARTATPTPTTAPGVRTHKVVAGDTAFGIALQYDTTVEALERANGVSKGGLDDLQLGQLVKLPPPGQR